MSRSTRIATAAAVVTSALALAPAALADGPAPFNGAHRTGPHGIAVVTVQTPDNRADRIGPAGTTIKVDTTGTGLIHASMVNAQLAAQAAAAPPETGFQWDDAGIGAAAGITAALAAAGLAAGVRNRRRIPA